MAEEEMGEIRDTRDPPDLRDPQRLILEVVRQGMDPRATKDQSEILAFQVNQGRLGREDILD
jgi:hypothetical protein